MRSARRKRTRSCTYKDQAHNRGAGTAEKDDGLGGEGGSNGRREVVVEAKVAGREEETGGGGDVIAGFWEGFDVITGLAASLGGREQSKATHQKPKQMEGQGRPRLAACTDTLRHTRQNVIVRARSWKTPIAGRLHDLHHRCMATGTPSATSWSNVLSRLSSLLSAARRTLRSRRRLG